MAKILLVTGGSRGIGAAVARMAAGRGYDVAVHYRSGREGAEAVAADVEAAGRRAITVQADIGEEAEVEAMFRTVDEKLGRLDALAANAGMLEQQMRVDEMTAARIERVMKANVVGVFVSAREAIRRMSTRHGGNGGSIVITSSVAARLGSPNEYVDYAASKGATDVMTIGLAKEVAAEGIRVNAVRPGLIRTDIHAAGGDPDRAERLARAIPKKRPGEAEEVAEVILWLMSDAASYVDGALIDVAGGR